MANYSRAHICQCLSLISTLKRSSVVTITGNRQKTGHQFVNSVFSLARGLLQLGLQNGDVVAISAFNSDWYLEWILAVAFVGGIGAPLNYRWDALKKKYDTEEAGAKKFAVSRYLKYQMTDDKSVEAQSHELQKIAHEIISEGMPLNEQFQVAVLIDKLPPSWKDFKNNLRHKTKEFSLESLITRLRIEEEAWKNDQKDEVLIVSNANKKSTSIILKPTRKIMKN